MGDTLYKVTLAEEEFITETKAVDTLKDTLKRLFPESTIEAWKGDPLQENIRVWQAPDLIIHLVYDRQLLDNNKDFEMPEL